MANYQDNTCVLTLFVTVEYLTDSSSLHSLVSPSLETRVQHSKRKCYKCVHYLAFLLSYSADRERDLQLGFNHVLSKPYTFTNVVERVEALKIV